MLSPRENNLSVECTTETNIKTQNQQKGKKSNLGKIESQQSGSTIVIWNSIQESGEDRAGTNQSTWFGLLVSIRSVHWGISVKPPTWFRYNFQKDKIINLRQIAQRSFEKLGR